MVRNSKRRAFTIVELVIVIAVIAILAAVMIPTFGGVIESANVSADKQILSTVNSQIAIYTGLGNKIETEADLWKALEGGFNGGSDMTKKFDPRSAKNGYHYWYNVAAQKVELLTYEEVTGQQSARFGKMVVLADSVARIAATDFAAASPRSFVNGYYLLDVTGKNANPLADLFADIDAMGADGTYKDALDNLDAFNKDNAGFVELISDKLKATAIVTDEGIFVNSAKTKINYVYIPAPAEGAADYFLGSAIKDETGATVQMSSANVGVVAGIEIPENVKLGDGCLAIFGTVDADITIKLESNEKIEEKIVSFVYAFSVKGTLSINGGADCPIEGNKITINGTEVLLNFRNTVKDFTIGVDGDIVDIMDQGNQTIDYYIALDKIKNENTITLHFNASGFTKNNENLPLYEHVEWTADNENVEIGELGEVTFKPGFNADTVVFTATATAGGKSNPFTVKVVRATNVTIKFESGKKSGTETIAAGGSYAPADFFVNYYDKNTVASLGELTQVKYGYQGVTVDFTTEEIEELGCTNPQIALTNKDGETKAYFTVTGNANDFTLAPNATNIEALTGTRDTQMVTVKVIDKGGDIFSADITVGVKDNHDTPFMINSAFPTYKVVYTYKVGNDSSIPLKVFFEKKAEATGNIGSFIVSAYPAEEEDFDGNIGNPNLTVVVDPNNWDDSVIDFADDFVGLAIIEIKTDDGDPDTEDYSETITVDVVDGVNIGKNFATNNKFANATDSTENLVLHSDFTIDDEADGTKDDKVNSDGVQDVTLNGTKIYGNYFTVHATTYVDTRVAANETYDDKGNLRNNMSNGYALIKMTGTSEICQLIVDGPVYEAAPEADDRNGLFCFGVIVEGSDTKTVKITDSYISGFMAPLRLVALNTTVELKNSVLEGGSFANIFLYQARKIVLDNSKTIQQSSGYDVTVKEDGSAGTASKKTIGFGIFINPAMYGTNGAAGKPLDVEFKNGSKQINWIENGKDFGGYYSTATLFVYLTDMNILNAKYLFASFMHADNAAKKGGPINAGILAMYLGKNATAPDVTITGVAYATEKKTLADFPKLLQAAAEKLLGTDFMANVYAPKHADSGCTHCANIAAEMSATFGYEWFSDQKVN